jgi:hypothetical protein
MKNKIINTLSNTSRIGVAGIFAGVFCVVFAIAYTVVQYLNKQEES